MEMRQHHDQQYELQRSYWQLFVEALTSHTGQGQSHRREAADVGLLDITAVTNCGEQSDDTRFSARAKSASVARSPASIIGLPCRRPTVGASTRRRFRSHSNQRQARSALSRTTHSGDPAPVIGEGTSPTAMMQLVVR